MAEIFGICIFNVIINAKCVSRGSASSRSSRRGTLLSCSVVRIIVSGKIVVCEKKLIDVVCATVQEEVILLW